MKMSWSLCSEKQDTCEILAVLTWQVYTHCYDQNRGAERILTPHKHINPLENAKKLTLSTG